MKCCIWTNRPLHGGQLDRSTRCARAPDVVWRGADSVSRRDGDAVHVYVRLGAAVQDADVVGGRAFAHPSHPRFQDGNISVRRLRRAHLLPDVVLLDRAQPPLGVLGEDVIPHPWALRRGLLFSGAARERVLAAVRAAEGPQAGVGPDSLLFTHGLVELHEAERKAVGWPRAIQHFGMFRMFRIGAVLRHRCAVLRALWHVFPESRAAVPAFPVPPAVQEEMLDRNALRISVRAGNRLF